MNTYRRVGLWLCSSVVSAIVFSLLCCLPVSFRSFAVFVQFTTILRSFLFVLQFTMILSIPAWLLYLPFVVAFKDTEHRRFWILMTSGTLIGPAYLIVFGLIVQLGGGDVHTIWQGDGGISLGIVQSIPLAVGLGFLTTSLYVISLKVTRRRSKTA